MQLFPSTTSSPSRTERLSAATLGNESAQRCAAMLLELMPRVMKTVRGSMGETVGGSLSMPQFRVMLYVEQNSGVSLSGLAEFLGLSLPSASKLVDHLVKRKLVERTVAEQDRRRVTLKVTAGGAEMLEASHARVRQVLSGVLGALDAGALGQAEEGLKVLLARFGPAAAGPDADGKGVSALNKDRDRDPRR